MKSFQNLSVKSSLSDGNQEFLTAGFVFCLASVEKYFVEQWLHTLTLPFYFAGFAVRRKKKMGPAIKKIHELKFDWIRETANSSQTFSDKAWVHVFTRVTLCKRHIFVFLYVFHHHLLHIFALGRSNDNCDLLMSTSRRCYWAWSTISPITHLSLNTFQKVPAKCQTPFWGKVPSAYKNIPHTVYLSLRTT